MRMIEKTTAALGLAAMLLMGACAHTNTVTTPATDYGRVVTNSDGTTAAVIPGPARVDSDGNVYTSSAAPGSGAGIGGTNTNVNIVPGKAKSTVTVVETPIVTTLVEAPLPPEVVIETPAQEPLLTTPMISSTTDTTTTETTTTTHRKRMSKD